MNRKFCVTRRAWWLALLVLPLAGCARLQSPEPCLPGQAAAVPQAWASPAVSGAVADDWLASFGDSNLVVLVNEALAGNPDLAATAARMDQSLASARIARASLWPSLDGGVSAQQSARLNRSESQKKSGLAANNTSFGASLDLSWELDVWGRLRYADRAARETAVAAALDYTAARRSLAAQVAKAWFAAAEARLQDQLNREFVDTYEKTLSLVAARYQSGSVAEQDLASARADLASARQRAQASSTAYREAVRSLEVLLGRYPAAELEAANDLQAVPPQIPAGLPSELLERRPDIQAAQRRVDAAFNSTQQARAARLPRISLTSSLGSSSTELKDLLDPKNAALNLAGNLVAPIFDAGQRKAQVESAQAQQSEAVASFQSTVLQAFQEVETYLLSGESLALEEVQLRESSKQYERARQLGEKRYTAGDIDLVDLLTLQRQELQSKSSLLSMRAERLAQRVNLHLALGGNFAASARGNELAAGAAQ